MYKHDIFYDTKHLSLKQKEELLRDAKERSYLWHVDKLDGARPRKRTDMTFEEVMKYLKGSHFVFINRQGYLENKDKADNWRNDWCIETGFRSMTAIDYFLFINCKEKHLDYFIKKYKLLKTL